MPDSDASSRPWAPFARLTDAQRARLQDYRRLLVSYNRKLNLISPATEEEADERHLLHSLVLAQHRFPAGSTVVDWGTGGGLPAIPLAICFPEVTVHAVDAVRKKVQAVNAMARRLGLTNLEAWHGRAEAWPGRTHYSVSRATAPLATLWTWHHRVSTAPLPGAPLPGADAAAGWAPGLLCLKGGDLAEEIAALREVAPEVEVTQHPLEPLLGRSYFREKYLLEVRERPA